MRTRPRTAEPTTSSPSGQSDDEEASLAAGLGRGDADAIATFFRRTHRSVFALAVRLAPDLDLAQDWTHDTLLGLVEDLRKGRFVYQRPGGFWSWFRKRAYYRLLNAHRKDRLRLHRETPIDPTNDDSEDPHGHPHHPIDLGGDENPAVELERTEIAHAFEACVDHLPNADHRRALWLHLREDQSYETVAEVMGAPLNTVKAWIRRGRLLVRLCMGRALGLVGPEEAIAAGEAPARNLSGPRIGLHPRETDDHN